MRCSDCKGIIEGNRPFCPHCGRPLSGVVRWITPGSPQDEAAGKVKATGLGDRPRADEDAAARIKDAGKRLAAEPVVQRIALGAVVGAVAAGFLPGIGWLFGAVIGGLIAYKSMRKS